MRLTPNEQNAFQTTRQLLRLAGVRVTDTALKTALYHHPDFPSLLSIGDVLKEFRVDNLATRIGPERLIEAPLPALAHFHTNEGTFVTLRKITSDSVEWYDEKRGWQTDSLPDFAAQWNGVLLLIEPSTTAGEPDYLRQRQLERLENLRLPFVTIGLMLCLGGWVSVNFTAQATSFPYYALLVLKLMGTAVSGLLVGYSLDADNPFLRGICQLNDRTNCGSVLNAPAAKLFGWLSWAEVGLFYFVGGLLSLLFSASTIPVILWFNLFALPYTLWSVYYQGRVIGQWCVLCLVVQVLLWAEFAVGQRAGWRFEVSTDGRTLAVTILCFLVTPAAWAFAKPFIGRGLRMDLLIRIIQRMKFNPTYLQALATSQRILPPVFNEMKTINVGNPEAEHTLIMVTTPTCAACRRNYQEVERLLAQGLDNINCRIILAATTNDADESSRITRAILNLPEPQMAQALHDWFAMEYSTSKVWYQSYSVDWLNENARQQLSLHLRWCELAGVTSTPTILLNGIKLGREYNVHEVPNLLARFSSLGIGQFT